MSDAGADMEKPNDIGNKNPENLSDGSPNITSDKGSSPSYSKDLGDNHVNHVIGGLSTLKSSDNLVTPFMSGVTLQEREDIELYLFEMRGIRSK